MGPVEVLPVPQEDRKTLRRLISTDFPAAAGNAIIRVPDSHWLWAIQDGEIRGYCGVQRRVQAHAYFTLARAYRPGLHVPMIRARLALAEEWGCTRVTTYTSNMNERSMRNLRAEGFREESREGEIVWWVKWL